MCGIHAAISANGSRSPSTELRRLLCERGPDHIGHENAQIDCGDGKTLWVSLTSTVLALRGDSITLQPFTERSTQSALCWNGEAWKIGHEPVTGNDGQAAFNCLLRAVSSNMSASDAVGAVLKVLRSISGPFSFVFLDRAHGQIYFGRDRLGRRSLLYQIENGCMEFASIADSMADGWREVEADGIYQLSLCHEVFPAAASNGPNDHIFSESILPLRRHSWDDENSLVSLCFESRGPVFQVSWRLFLLELIL